MITHLKNNLCPAAWTALYIDPTGRVDNCCISNNHLGNINDTKIVDIINGDKAIAIRQQMSDNDLVPGCSNCHNREHTWQQKFVDTYGTDFDAASHFNLKYLDLRWNNTCNFACIYCSPTFSSLWAEELGQINKIQDTASIKHYVLDNVNQINELYLAGGEPLLLKDNQDVLAKLLDVNPNAKIFVNTNLSRLDTAVAKLLFQFNNVQWLVSGEDTAERYEYIRWPGKWLTFYNNIVTLVNRDINQVSFNLVMMNINALTIWDYVDLLIHLGCEQHSITVNLYNFGDPAGPYSPRRLTSNQKQEVLDRINQKNYTVLGIEDIRNALALDKKYDLNYTLDSLQKLDNSRSTDSSKIFTHFYKGL